MRTRLPNLRRASVLAALATLLAACADSPPPTTPEVGSPDLARGAGGPPFITTSVTTGEAHACALAKNGSAYCWGSNDAGQLGDGTTEGSTTPVAVAGRLRFASLSAGGYHTCGLTREGAAYCWGDNVVGQLGDGGTQPSGTPTPVAGGVAFSSISAGWRHTCALTEEGEAYCWGTNRLGEHGAPSAETCGTVACNTTPVATRTEVRFSSLSSGLSHTCAVDADGAAYCWGWNALYQLGDGTRATRAEPRAVAGGLRFASVSSGAGQTCGVTTDGAAYCWGGFNRFSGALGNGSFADNPVPTPVVGGLTFASVVASKGNYIGSHACGITTDGAAYCWGADDAGQLGGTAAAETCTIDDRFPCTARPLPVAGGLTFGSLSLSTRFTCATADRGRPYCWGLNEQGQLGDGSVVNAYEPARVEAPERGKRPKKPGKATVGAGARIAD